ncbi:MAG: hypothetical protein JSV37_03115, partial [Anaerolineaceae bacterium]
MKIQRLEHFMRNSGRVMILTLILLILIACNGAPTSLEPTQKLVTTATPFKPPKEEVPTLTPPAGGQTATGPCYMIPNTEIIAYLRPSSEAEIFDAIPDGIKFVVEGRTADGWVGFNPGIPQAPIIGVFRYRWIPENSDFRLEGACEDIPIVESPPANVCFAMAMEAIPVYAEPDTSSGIVVTLEREGYVEVKHITADQWLMVDLNVGSLGISQAGWIKSLGARFNGPCYALITEIPTGPPIAHLDPGEPATITFIQMITKETGWAIGRGSKPEDHILRTTDGGETWID